MVKKIFLSMLLVLPVLAVPKISLPPGVSPGDRFRPFWATGDDAPSSNAIGDIEYNPENGDIWVSTGSGISVSHDGARTWENKLSGNGFAALAVLGDWVWAAASYDYEDPTDPNNSLPAGDAFYISFDGGETFEHCTTANEATGVGKLAYDIAIFPDGEDTLVYAACFYGGLIYSSDRGATWQNAFPDGSDSLNYSDLGHRFFSVAVDTSVDPPEVWAGSARGLFVGREGTFAWEKIDTAGHWIPDSIPIFDTTWVDSSTFEVDSVSNYYIVWGRDSLDEGALSGNWIISIDLLNGDSTGVFACTRATSTNNAGGDYDAISFSFDNGTTWHQTGDGYVAWNMGFTGDTLWAACKHGLSRSFPPDYTTSDTVKISGTDVNSGNHIDVLLDEVVSATDCDSILCVGTYSEGIAITPDRGETWRIVAHFPSASEAATQDPNADPADPDYVYAFPNPYSPVYHKSCFFAFEAINDAPVTIELFDYDIRKVATIYNGDVQQQGKCRIQWDGTLDNGAYPKNGLYFFKIEQDDKTRWGKLMIAK